jgi:toxin ParE1/3/4
VPLEIVWSPLARARLREIRAYIALDKSVAAERMATRIVAIVEALRSHPHLGRPGADPGFRELIVGGSPYIIVYQVKRKRITVTNISHAAQREHP